MKNIKLVVPHNVWEKVKETFNDYDKTNKMFDRLDELEIPVVIMSNSDETTSMEIIGKMNKNYEITMKDVGLTIPDNYIMYLDSVYDIKQDEYSDMMMLHLNSGLYENCTDNNFVNIDSKLKFNSIKIWNNNGTCMGHKIEALEGLSPKVLERYDRLKNQYRTLPPNIMNISDLTDKIINRNFYIGILKDNEKAFSLTLVYGMDKKIYIGTTDEPYDAPIASLCCKDKIYQMGLTLYYIDNTNDSMQILIDIQDMDSINNILSDDELSDEAFMQILIFVSILNLAELDEEEGDEE